MAIHLKLDPAPTDDDYRRWLASGPTRPLTWGGLGVGTAGRRRSGERLSRLMDGRERERFDRVTIKSPWTGRLYVVRRR